MFRRYAIVDRVNQVQALQQEAAALPSGDGCWELSSRIRSNPELARRILEEQNAGKTLSCGCDVGVCICDFEV